METKRNHGGKREGSGRKGYGGPTTVIHVPTDLLPAIEILKSGKIHDDLISESSNRDALLEQVKTLISNNIFEEKVYSIFNKLEPVLKAAIAEELSK